MKKVFKLYKGKHINTDEWQLRGEGLICVDGLQEFFGIPNSAHTLYVTLSDKPSSKSYEVNTELWCGRVDTIKLNIPDKPDKIWEPWTYNRLDQFVNDLNIRHFFISVDYI